MAIPSYQPCDDTNQFIARCINDAQNRIAPTWPLDQFIAVNPYWGWTAEPFAVVAKKIWQLANSPLTMSPDYFQEQWNAGQFSQKDLQAAIDFGDQNISLESLQSRMHSAGCTPEKPILITRLVDQRRDLSHALSWQQFVKHQISQHCAAYFDQGQAKWHPQQTMPLYDSWKQNAINDQGPLLQLGFKRFEQAIRQLPSGATDLINTVLPQLGLPQEQWSDYLTALLIDINGWAAWCSYVKWQAQLAQQQSDQIVQLLATRLAWEWVLLQQYPPVLEEFNSVWNQLQSQDAALESQCASNELLLRGLEYAYQEPLARALLRAKLAEKCLPDFQAVFCIDVRSEVFRRALEASHPKLETRGFAGFFGLPISYRERGTELSQPQLPGLLAPKYWASEQSAATGLTKRLALLDQKRWQDMRHNASSTFSFVETLGLLYGAKLIRSALSGQRGKSAPEQRQEEPELALYSDSSLSHEVGLAEKVAMAKQILVAMGMRQNFSRLVLLIGHGTTCTNNPHAASLDCGACGGQNGAINVRLLAGMLNDLELRKQLRKEQIDIPDSTWFIAGLHNTTTDHIHLYNLLLVPTTHRADLAQFEVALTTASRQTRTGRAAALGIADDAENLENSLDAFTRRSLDWAQTRPEWGLANNAAFIVAPRSRTVGLNLNGRTFLHDYDWQSDSEFAILELIMTAPMVVTNWINMQYYASVVDPQRYGSGSKILHNVVGQRLGVFEGNGGDLRIGLPWQSVHNGTQLMHTPLRLSVLIEAPRAEIVAILEKNTTLRQLVDNRWLHLFQIDAQENRIYYRNQCQWSVFADNSIQSKAA